MFSFVCLKSVLCVQPEVDGNLEETIWPPTSPHTPSLMQKKEENMHIKSAIESFCWTLAAAIRFCWGPDLIAGQLVN